MRMPNGADDDRRDDQRGPIVHAGVLQQQERRERAHHVLGAVREIDDVEHAEDDGEPEAQQRVERAVDQPEQQLANNACEGMPKISNMGHDLGVLPPPQGERVGARSDEPGGESVEHPDPHPPSLRRRVTLPACGGGMKQAQLPASGQLPSLSGRKASAAGMVART